jgi:hypothetical protein
MSVIRIGVDIMKNYKIAVAGTRARNIIGQPRKTTITKWF